MTRHARCTPRLHHHHHHTPQPPPPPPPKVQTHSFSRCEVRCLLCSHQFCTFMWTASLAEHAGAAMRRRQRRLRQWLRHERLSVAMALAESQHHAAPRGQSMARAGGGVRVGLYGDDPEQLPPQAAGALHSFLDLDEAPAAGGSRPDRLPEVRPQERVQRHTVDQIIAAPLLDVPVPLMEEQLLLDVFRPHDRQVPELVIDVPKIICEDIPTRSSVPEPQLVEQLMDVPTVLSVAVLQQRTAEAREEEMEELLAVPPRLRSTAQWARLRELISASSQAWRRKRKKRRKRRLPRTSSRLSRCRKLWSFHIAVLQHCCRLLLSCRKRRSLWSSLFRRPQSFLSCCTFQAGFAGYNTPRAVFPSLSSGPRCPSSWPAWTTGQFGVHRCISWTRFSTCPSLCYVWCLGPDSAVLAVPQLQFITVVSLPVVTQMQIPMVLAVQMTIEITQLLLIGGLCSCCAGSCRFSGAAVEKPLALAQLQLVEKSVVGLFWVMTSGNVPVFSAYWLTLDTCLRQFTEAWFPWCRARVDNGSWFCWCRRTSRYVSFFVLRP